VARLRVTAVRASIVPLQLGFSDAATAFLNERPLFHGDDSYAFMRRRDGLIGLDQATVYLPMRAGLNDLSIVVRDPLRGVGADGTVSGRNRPHDLTLGQVDSPCREARQPSRFHRTAPPRSGVSTALPSRSIAQMGLSVDRR
jgi:hypothetical protein